MTARAGLVLILSLAAGPAQAESGLPLLRPMPRPTAQPSLEPAANTVKPLPRPALVVLPVAAPLPQVRPAPRPDFAATPIAMAPMPQKAAKASMKGAVCQRAEIRGKALPPIRSRVKGCNVPDAVQVSEIAGVALSPPATINCEEAGALLDWITKGLQPSYDNAVVRLEVADSYACRPRNNVPGNPVSVHGLGQAIDISAIVTASGRSFTVAANHDAAMRRAEKAGCAMFSTILGPGSDGYHENHMHFDVAHHGGGHYCH